MPFDHGKNEILVLQRSFEEVVSNALSEASDPAWLQAQKRDALLLFFSRLVALRDESSPYKPVSVCDVRTVVDQLKKDFRNCAHAFLTVENMPVKAARMLKSPEFLERVQELTTTLKDTKDLLSNLEGLLEIVDLQNFYRLQKPMGYDDQQYSAQAATLHIAAPVREAA